MKSKQTKKALLVSTLSLVLCLALLIGTTFAWFTDSVTSGKNTIVAGNLDVELYEVGADGSETKVDAETNLFDEDALWEPGYTEVAYLKVANEGTLALKYKFAINVADKVIGKTAADEDIDLAQYLRFGVVEAEEKFETRDAARAAAETAGTKLISEGYASEEGYLEAGARSAKMIAIVVYMPETVGNEANHGTGKQAPSISMGIELLATQYTFEEDSFGIDYDETAEYDAFASTGADITAALSDGRTIYLSDRVALENNLTVNKNVTIVGNSGTAITNYPVYVGADNTVTFKNVNFADTTVKENASSVYGSGFKGTMIFDGCTFGDSNWESIQITPKGDAEIIIRNCTFTATKDMKRFIHIQPAASNTYKLNITIENCTFNGCEYVNYNAGDSVSVIDLDYIATGSTMTLGGCRFFNTDGSEATNAHAYFCKPAPSYEMTYDYAAMYTMLTGAVQTYTVE